MKRGEEILASALAPETRAILAAESRADRRWNLADDIEAGTARWEGAATVWTLRAIDHKVRSLHREEE
jgi:hypothetical protein